MHRDYNIANEEENLSARQKADKTDVFCTYAEHDENIPDCSTYGDGAHGSWRGSQYSSAQVTYAHGWLAGLSDKCLDLPGGNATNGTTLQIRDCADVPHQKWTLTGGKIQLAGANKCVDLRGADTTNGTPVQIWDCADVPSQKWTLTSDGMLRGLDGKCLDVRGADPANGTVVQVWDCVAQPASGGGLEVVPQQSWTPRFGPVAAWTSGGLLSDSDASGRYGLYSFYYGSVRLGDVNGDHLADVCGRRPDGVYCALNQGAPASALSRSTPKSSATRATWATEMHGITLMLGDVNGDGRADACGRGGNGIFCATANATGTAFVPDFRAWTSSFSSATELAAGAQYYGSLRLVDVDGDGYADVCGRGAGGIQCAINNRQRAFKPAATWLGTEYLDSLGWGAERYGMTIAFGDINGDGRADVCGRGGGKIFCATGKAGGGFETRAGGRCGTISPTPGRRPAGARRAPIADPSASATSTEMDVRRRVRPQPDRPGLRPVERQRLRPRPPDPAAGLHRRRGLARRPLRDDAGARRPRRRRRGRRVRPRRRRHPLRPHPVAFLNVHAARTLAASSRLAAVHPTPRAPRTAQNSPATASAAAARSPPESHACREAEGAQPSRAARVRSSGSRPCRGARRARPGCRFERFDSVVATFITGARVYSA